MSAAARRKRKARVRAKFHAKHTRGMPDPGGWKRLRTTFRDWPNWTGGMRELRRLQRRSRNRHMR